LQASMQVIGYVSAGPFSAHAIPYQISSVAFATEPLTESLLKPYRTLTAGMRQPTRSTA